MSGVTQILDAIHRGEDGAAERLLPVVYRELRKLAASRIARERSGGSIEPTMLVHEAYIRLVDVDSPQEFNGRAHFFAAAAEAMRRILIEAARRRRSIKRGGALRRVSLDGVELAADRPADELVALDEALVAFESRWPDKAMVVKLRYFAGLTISETAQALGLSSATVERYWSFARAWLYGQLQDARNRPAESPENPT